MITQSLLKELFFYDETSGMLFWKVTPKNRKRGGNNIAGGITTEGYVSIRINGTRYRCHRLVWLLLNGFLPENKLDHINRDRSDNRIENLREVSDSCNVRNSTVSKRNRSGVKGVHWSSSDDKWVASIFIQDRLHNKKVTIFRSNDLTEAACYRLAYEQCLGWPNCDTSSSAFAYINSTKSKK